MDPREHDRRRVGRRVLYQFHTPDVGGPGYFGVVSRGGVCGVAESRATSV
jgi:hypothetical protein